jgi:hypothetical protein
LTFQALLAAGDNPASLRGVFAALPGDDSLLLAVLRRPVAVRALELLAATPPFADKPRVLGGIVLSPRSPRTLALRLLPSLLWRDLAETAATMRITPAVRQRSEALLQDRLSELRLGDRIALARIATPPVLRSLLADADAKVVRAALQNPRLRETDLTSLVEGSAPGDTLLREAAASTRWRHSYALRLSLALQPRTPLDVALLQISSLLPRDLRRLAATEGLRPLVRASARRVEQELRNPRAH